MLWPKAMAGVVRSARFQPPRPGFRQRCPSLSKKGSFSGTCRGVVTPLAKLKRERFASHGDEKLLQCFFSMFLR
jgi:hypothetical protein